VTALEFGRLHHLITVPATIGGVQTRFVLDSGIGLTIVADSLAEAAHIRPLGSSFTGRRMSGQEVTVPLAHAASLAVGELEQDDVVVGMLDMSPFPDELGDLGGFLSLTFFAETPFTVDYCREEIVLETAESLAARRACGTELDLRLERDGPSLTAFCRLTLPNARSVWTEVDMGSDALILDERLAPELGVDLSGEAVRAVQGVDETGHDFTRFFTQLDGCVHADGAAGIAQEAPEVMFQRIIYDGLVGDAFLRRFVATFDLPRAQLLLARCETVS
jgi:hypothetical protein